MESEDAPTPKEIASLRWKAVEAVNAHPSLTAAARRVFTYLLTTMNAKTGLCCPSTARIADVLHMHEVTVKKAKQELYDANLIDWSNPGGSRHLSYYTFIWSTLVQLCEIAQRRGAEGSEIRRKLRKVGDAWSMNGSAETTEAGTNGSVKTTMAWPGTEQNGTLNGRGVADVGSQKIQDSSVSATDGVAARLPELTQELSQLDISQSNPPIRAGEMVASPFAVSSEDETKSRLSKIPGWRQRPTLRKLVEAELPHLESQLARLAPKIIEEFDRVRGVKGSAVAIAQIKQEFT